MRLLAEDASQQEERIKATIRRTVQNSLRMLNVRRGPEAKGGIKEGGFGSGVN